MRSYRVVLDPDAEAELIEAYKYIKRDSADNAIDWLIGFWKLVEGLADWPFRAGYAPESHSGDPTHDR